MKSKLLILLISFATYSNLVAQTLLKRDSIVFKGIETVSVDQSGNIYLANINGSLKKYRSNGTFISEFSPQKKAQLL